MQPKPPVPQSRVAVTLRRGDTIDFVESTSLGPDEVLQASTSGIKDFGKVAYPRVGRCVYCEATDDLRREHIIPFGLSGNAVLPAASCRRCAKITSKFEAQVLRGPMRSVRVLRNLRSGSKHNGAPVTERLDIIRKGVRETVELQIDEYPVVLHFPVFAPPGLLTGPSRPGIEITGVVSVSFGPSPQAVLARLGAQEIVLESQRDRPAAFARMIAKIGYAMAFAEGALSGVDGPSPVLPAILGEVDNIGRWVGTLTEPIRKYPGLLHRIAIREDLDRCLIVAEVQLFADSETPSYGVILGSVKKS